MISVRSMSMIRKAPDVKPRGFGSAPLRTALAHISGAALVSVLLIAHAQGAHAQGAHAWSALDGAPSDAAMAARGGRTVQVGLGGEGGANRNLSLPKGKSAVIELPVDARDVLVSNPKVADVVLSTPRRIYVLGQASGQTDATFVDGLGHQILRLNIRVDGDTSAVAETLNHILPGSSVHVEAVNDRLILSGEVPNAADADKAMRIAQSFVEKPEDVLNMLSVAGPEQVMLKVRIVEVNRQIIKQLGVNLSALVGQLGNSQFLFNTAASFGVNGALLGGLSAAGYALDSTQQPTLQVPCTGGAGTCTQIIKPGNNYTYVQGHNADGSLAYNTDGSPRLIRTLIGNPGTATTTTTVGSNGLNKAASTLEAFEQTGLVRTLAEPNLTAVSGESAKFLAGGEFPVPVSEDNNGRVTVEFKQFGVGLGFTPVVLSSGRISLKLSTEYSELTDVGSFNMTGSSGVSNATTTTSAGTSSTASVGANLTIPGLNVRRAETVVELPSGGSMMIAGLMESVNKQSIASLPGLTQLPVLGALFRSRDYLQGETELVVIVTPYLVKPGRPDEMQTPADGLQIADDASTYLLGRLNKGFDKPAAPLPGKSYQGPFGYVVQ